MEAQSNDVITVRTMNIIDLYKIHRMYDSLSYRTKLFFHPGFLGFKERSLKWFVIQFALILSSNSICRKILKCIFPQIVFIPIVAVNSKGDVIGFAYIKVKDRLANGKFIGNLGIVIKDSYQGRGIGKILMNNLITYAKKEKIKSIYLTVLTDNVKAIRLYEKYGFVRLKVIKGGDNWCDKNLDCVEMVLHLE